MILFRNQTTIHNAIFYLGVVLSRRQKKRCPFLPRFKSSIWLNFFLKYFRLNMYEFKHWTNGINVAEMRRGNKELPGEVPNVVICFRQLQFSRHCDSTKLLKPSMLIILVVYGNWGLESEAGRLGGVIETMRHQPEVCEIFPLTSRSNLYKKCSIVNVQ